MNVLMSVDANNALKYTFILFFNFNFPSTRQTVCCLSGITLNIRGSHLLCHGMLGNHIVRNHVVWRASKNCIKIALLFDHIID